MESVFRRIPSLILPIQRQHRVGNKLRLGLPKLHLSNIDWKKAFSWIRKVILHGYDPLPPLPTAGRQSQSDNPLPTASAPDHNEMQRQLNMFQEAIQTIPIHGTETTDKQRVGPPMSTEHQRYL